MDKSKETSKFLMLKQEKKIKWQEGNRENPIGGKKLEG